MADPRPSHDQSDPGTWARNRGGTVMFKRANSDAADGREGPDVGRGRDFPPVWRGRIWKKD